MRLGQLKSRFAFVLTGLLALTTLVAACGQTTETTQAPAGPPTTVFEGARVIVGDGSAPIENGVVVVRDTQFVQVGRAGEVQVPEGATRVNLAGKTVMPAILDAHVHLRSQMRETLIEDLQRRAYYGVVAAISMGQD
jgi:imidazolonepropionase-like amidohydrolase